MVIKGTRMLISGLDCLPNLIELELYDNKILKIQGLDKLIHLELLDLSYNNLKKIENLSHLKKLKKLFLLSNKIKKVNLISNRLKTYNSHNWKCSSWDPTKLNKFRIYKALAASNHCFWARIGSLKLKIYLLWSISNRQLWE